MRRMLLPLALFTLVAAGCAPDIVYREDVASPRDTWNGDQFVRYNGYDNVTGTLQASSTTYVHPITGTHLTLVGAIHIGDANYYHAVQQDLDAADLVLFELVKPANVDVRDMNMQSQEGMYSPIAKLFGLAEQMQEVDYRRDHFQWLDMSAEQFQGHLQTIIQKATERLQKQLNEGTISQAQAMEHLKRALMDAPRELQLAWATAALQVPQLRQMEPAPAADPIAMVIDLALTPLRIEKQVYGVISSEKAFEDKYKHSLAAGLNTSADPNASVEAMKGQDPIMDILVDALVEFQTIIIEERNDIVVDGITELLESGEAPKNVTVWYGAGHYPGIANSLIEYGFEPVEADTKWYPVITIER